MDWWLWRCLCLFDCDVDLFLNFLINLLNISWGCETCFENTVTCIVDWVTGCADVGDFVTGTIGKTIIVGISSEGGEGGDGGEEG